MKDRVEYKLVFEQDPYNEGIEGFKAFVYDTRSLEGYRLIASTNIFKDLETAIEAIKKAIESI